MPVLKPSFASCETRCVLNAISVQHYESKDTRSLLGESSKFLCIAMAIDDEHADVEMKAMTQLNGCWEFLAGLLIVLDRLLSI